MKREPRTITLFSNLSFVTIGDVRTHCAAMILEPRDPNDDRPAGSFMASRDQIRGFCLGASSPCFDLRPPSLEYTSEDGQSPHLFIGDGPDAKPRPLSTGVILTFKGGPTLQLVASPIGQRGIEVERITHADHSALYETLWARMDRRISEFCDTPAQLVVVPRTNPHYGRQRGQRGG